MHPLQLLLVNIWGLTPMFVSNGVYYYIAFVDAFFSIQGCICFIISPKPLLPSCVSGPFVNNKLILK